MVCRQVSLITVDVQCVCFLQEFKPKPYLELRGDRELNSMRAMMCCWLWPTLSQHSDRELQGSNAEPSLAAWALSHGQHNYQVQGCKSGEEGQAHLEHRRDEAAVRHGDGQGDVDMLIVGDALGIRRAHCRRGEFWLLDSTV